MANYKNLSDFNCSSSREWSPIPEYAFIRASYGPEDQSDDLEEQLEDALEDEAIHIIIESKRIGDETTKWIQMGNFLHKSTVLTGFSCIVTGLTVSTKYNNYICIPFGVFSLSCASLYGVSWQYDPCCKYQIEQDPQTLASLQIENLTSSLVVVLKRREDKYRKRLHNFFALGVAGYFGWKCYRWYTQ